MHQLWITPHGVLKAAQRNRRDGAAQRRAGATAVVVQPARPLQRHRCSIGADGLVTQVDSRLRRSGARRHARRSRRTPTTATSAASSSRCGCARRWAAIPVLDLAVSDVQANPAAVASTCPRRRATSGRARRRRKARPPASGSSPAARTTASRSRWPDHLVLVEAPLNDGRTRGGHRAGEDARARQADPLRRQQPRPLRPFRRPARRGRRRARRSSPSAANVPYFERAFATPNRIAPTAWRRPARSAKFVAVADKLAMGDATRAIELHRITGTRTATAS